MKSAAASRVRRTAPGRPPRCRSYDARPFQARGQLQLEVSSSSRLKARSRSRSRSKSRSRLEVKARGQGQIEASLSSRLEVEVGSRSARGRLEARSRPDRGRSSRPDRGRGRGQARGRRRALQPLDRMKSANGSPRRPQRPRNAHRRLRTIEAPSPDYRPRPFKAGALNRRPES